MQGLAGNWNLGAIVTLESGHPFDVLAGADVANTGGPSQRAQRTGAAPYASKQSPKNWLNKAAFAIPTPFTFGNEGRNDLVGPAYRDVDLNAYKDFPLGKTAHLQFRAEFFNVLNSTNYNSPASDGTNNVQNAAFGQLLSAAGPGREIQFAAKLLF